MSSFWHAEYKNIRNFDTISAPEQRRILDVLKTPKAASDYWFDSAFATLTRSSHIDAKDYVDIVENFIQNRNDSYSTYNIYDFIHTSYQLDPSRTKQFVLDNKTKTCSRTLLFMNPDKEQEIRGLRALTKVVPPVLIATQYKPSKDALEELPPVMRLNVLEALAFASDSNYNVFGNITKEDLENFLFPCITRHSSRVSSVLGRYEEIAHRGNAATMHISGECEKCGPFTFSVTTEIFRTAESFKKTNVGRYIFWGGCSLCGSRKLKSGPTFEVEL